MLVLLSLNDIVRHDTGHTVYIYIHLPLACRNLIHQLQPIPSKGDWGWPSYGLFLKTEFCDHGGSRSPLFGCFSLVGVGGAQQEK